MKYSEGLFHFPVKVHDPFSVTKAILKEDKRFNNVVTEEDIEELHSEESDWVRGLAVIPVEEIKGYTDIFPEGKAASEVAEEGFEETMIITKTLGNFECLWKLSKFEEKLDEFVEKYAKGIDDMVEVALKEKAEKKEEFIPKKRRLWYRK